MAAKLLSTIRLCESLPLHFRVASARDLRAVLANRSARLQLTSARCDGVDPTRERHLVPLLLSPRNLSNRSIECNQPS